MLHDAQTPLSHTDSAGQPEIEETKTMSPQEIAEQTYKEHEEEWLLEHPGEYAWVVGKQVRFFINLEDLYNAMMEEKEIRKGITIKIEKCEPPVYYIS